MTGSTAVAGEWRFSDNLAGAFVMPGRCDHGRQALQDANRSSVGVSAVVFQNELSVEGGKDRSADLAQRFEERAAGSFGFGLAHAEPSDRAA
jgi:hypothetical protein